MHVAAAAHIELAESVVVVVAAAVAAADIVVDAAAVESDDFDFAAVEAEAAAAFESIEWAEDSLQMHSLMPRPV